MKRSSKQIQAQYQKALTQKAKWDALYEDVYRYGMPGRYNETRELGTRGDTSGNTERQHLYTSVMEQSCDRFVQRVQSMLTPVGVDWIDFEAGYLFKELDTNQDDIEQKLSRLSHMLNVYKDTSNFDSVVTECYYDLIAGTLCLGLLEGTVDEPFRFVAIPFKDIAIEDGMFGEVGAVYRKLKMPKALIKKQWANAKYEQPKENGDDSADLIECTYKDYDTDEWQYVVLEDGKNDFIVQNTYKTCPFIILRWAKCAGETYGRGLGLKAISDVKTLNKVVEYSLRALAFTIPVFLSQSDNIYDVSTFKMEPGAINPVPSTATNNPTITQLGVNQQPDMSNFCIEKLEMNIKRCMLDDTIPNDPSRHLTATEIAHRSEELQNNFSNSFGRIMKEFMYPLIRRMVEVAQRFGYIPEEFDPKLFNGFGYKIKINTILASGQKQQEVQNTINALQTFCALDQNAALLPKVLKLDKMLPDLMRKMGIDDAFISTAEEVQMANTAEAQAVQAQANDQAARQMAIDENKERAKNESP